MKNSKNSILKSLLAVIIIIIYAAPFYVLINVAIKPLNDTSSYWKPSSTIFLENFTTALIQGKLLQALLNSALITTVSVLVIILFGAFAAYPLARRRTKLNKGIKSFVLGVMMVPPLSILVPLFSTMVALKGLNTYWGIIVVLVTFELPLSIYLYSNFINSIPTALDEAADIDGCGPIRTFFYIILPQLKPVTASVAILTGMHCWNDYQFSLYLLQKSELRTISLSIASFFSQSGSNLHAATAGAFLAVLPALFMFLFFQKYFIQGMVDSAVK